MVLALLVLGPERLPKVARSVGYWFGKARRYVEGMKEQVEAEFDTTEVKRLLHNQDVQLRELKDKLSSTESSVNAELKNQFDDEFDDDDPGNGHQENADRESKASAEPQYEIIEEDDTPKSYLDSKQSPLVKKQAAREQAAREQAAQEQTAREQAERKSDESPADSAQ